MHPEEVKREESIATSIGTNACVESKSVVVEDLEVLPETRKAVNTYLQSVVTEKQQIEVYFYIQE